MDFGFYAANPASFAQWQAQNPLGGQNGPALDPDGDGLTNAAEYAFGLPPSTGLNGWTPFEIKLNSNTNQIDAIARTLIAFDDVTVTLQGIDNLATSPAGWFDITSITPVITSNVAGLQTTEYRNLEQLTAFTGGKGFVRLRVVLDANRDGTPEATTYTDVWTWSRRLLQAQTITYSNPFLKSAVFKGAVTAVTGNSLDVAAAVGGSSIAAAMTGTIPLVHRSHLGRQ